MNLCLDQSSIICRELFYFNLILCYSTTGKQWNGCGFFHCNCEVVGIDLGIFDEKLGSNLRRVSIINKNSNILKK